MTLQRGDIWWVDFGDVLPGPPAGLRPAVIVSSDGFNASAALMVTVVPGTTRQHGLAAHVVVPAAESGLAKTTVFQPELITTVAKAQLLERAGRLSAITMQVLTTRLVSFLELD